MAQGLSLSLFGWCATGQHDKCLRKTRGFFLENKKLFWRDVIHYCSCKKRTCPCSKMEKSPFDKRIVNG